MPCSIFALIRPAHTSSVRLAPSTVPASVPMVSACSPCLYPFDHTHAYMHTCTHRNEQDSGPLFLQSRGTYRLVCGEATPILRGEGTAAAAGVSAGGQEEEQQQQQGWRRLRALGWGQEYG